MGYFCQVYNLEFFGKPVEHPTPEPAGAKDAWPDASRGTLVSVDVKVDHQLIGGCSLWFDSAEQAADFRVRLWDLLKGPMQQPSPARGTERPPHCGCEGKEWCEWDASGQYIDRTTCRVPELERALAEAQVEAADARRDHIAACKRSDAKDVKLKDLEARLSEQVAQYTAEVDRHIVAIGQARAAGEKAERARAAKIADEAVTQVGMGDTPYEIGWNNACRQLAAAIRQQTGTAAIRAEQPAEPGKG